MWGLWAGMSNFIEMNRTPEDSFQRLKIFRLCQMVVFRRIFKFELMVWKIFE